MSDTHGIVGRLVASVRALLHGDWIGPAGDRFRRTIRSISDFAREQRVRPEDIAEEGLSLARRKLEGLANKELASAVKDFAEAEHKKIEAELYRRSLESKVRQEEAKARLDELKVVDAEVELLKKLKDVGVVLRYDERGNLTVFSASSRCDLETLATRKLLNPGEPEPTGNSPQDVDDGERSQ